MTGPREIALGIASAIQTDPNPVPLEFQGFDARSAAELIAQIARELVDADIRVKRVELPQRWVAETEALLDECGLVLPIVAVESFSHELKIYRTI